LFYIRLENQVHLLIILIFSAYIYLSSLSIKLDPFLKNLGASFFSPLILGIMSFLSLNTAFSESYLFFSELILITAVLIAIAFKNSKEINSLVFILLYAFPPAAALLNLNFGFLNYRAILDIILFSFTGIIVLVIIVCIIGKRYSLMVLYTGILFICASLVIPETTALNITVIAALLLKATGYMLCAGFFCKSSVYRLQQEYEKVSGELNRINDNIQREINFRAAHMDQLRVRPQDVRKTDMLTGTYTNKAILDFVEMHMEKYPDKEFSVLLIDIDNFSEINSKLGKNAGNKCIRDLAGIIKSKLRNDDKVGRLEETCYLAVMPGTNAGNAYSVADQLKKEVETKSSPHITVSVGVASYPQDAGNLKEIINAAKKAMHASKK